MKMHCNIFSRHLVFHVSVYISSFPKWIDIISFWIIIFISFFAPLWLIIDCFVLYNLELYIWDFQSYVDVVGMMNFVGDDSKMMEAFKFQTLMKNPPNSAIHPQIASHFHNIQSNNWTSKVETATSRWTKIQFNIRILSLIEPSHNDNQQTKQLNVKIDMNQQTRQRNNIKKLLLLNREW